MNQIDALVLSVGDVILPLSLIAYSKFKIYFVSKVRRISVLQKFEVTNVVGISEEFLLLFVNAKLSGVASWSNKFYKTRNDKKLQY